MSPLSSDCRIFFRSSVIVSNFLLMFIFWTKNLYFWNKLFSYLLIGLGKPCHNLVGYLFNSLFIVTNLLLPFQNCLLQRLLELLFAKARYLGRLSILLYSLFFLLRRIILFISGLSFKSNVFTWLVNLIRIIRVTVNIGIKWITCIINSLSLKV